MRKRHIMDDWAGDTLHKPWVLRRITSSPPGSLPCAESAAVRGQASRGSASNLIFSSLERRLPAASQAACARFPGGKSCGPVPGSPVDAAEAAPDRLSAGCPDRARRKPSRYSFCWAVKACSAALEEIICSSPGVLPSPGFWSDAIALSSVTRGFCNGQRCGRTGDSWLVRILEAQSPYQNEGRAERPKRGITAAMRRLGCHSCSHSSVYVIAGFTNATNFRVFGDCAVHSEGLPGRPPWPHPAGIGGLP